MQGELAGLPWLEGGHEPGLRHITCHSLRLAPVDPAMTYQLHLPPRLDVWAGQRYGAGLQG